MIPGNYHRRVVIVDYKGRTVLDKYVAPTMQVRDIFCPFPVVHPFQVSDYRTSTTGITAAQLTSSISRHCTITLDSTEMPSTGNALTFSAIQQYVASVVEGKVLVGHSIWNDLSGSSRHFPVTLR